MPQAFPAFILKGGAPVKQKEQPADAPQKKATTNVQDEDEIDPISVLRRVKAAIKAAKTDENVSDQFLGIVGKLSAKESKLIPFLV